MEAFFTFPNKSLTWPQDWYPIVYHTTGLLAVYQYLKCGPLKHLAQKLLPAKPKTQFAKDTSVGPDGLQRQDSAVAASELEHVHELTSSQQKFITASFRFLFFSYFIIFGLIASDEREPGSQQSYFENWLYQPDNWFRGYPHLAMTGLLKHYYCASLAHYLFESITLFIEPKQKDFWQMLAHHFVTVILMWFSYGWGFHRIGTVILLLHDVSDPLMELAKTCLYTNRNDLANVFFGLFALTFLTTRCGIFSFVVLPSTWNARRYMPPNVHNGVMVCLSTLQVLHIFWSFLIIKLAIKSLYKGVEGDPRDMDTTNTEVEVEDRKER